MQSRASRGKTLATCCVVFALVGWIMGICAALSHERVFPSGGWEGGIWVLLTLVCGITAWVFQFVAVVLACVHIIKRMSYQEACFLGLGMAVIYIVVSIALFIDRFLVV